MKSKVPQYLVAGVKLRNHLHNRQLPVEEGERWQMVKEEMVEVAKSCKSNLTDLSVHLTELTFNVP